MTRRKSPSFLDWTSAAKDADQGISAEMGMGSSRPSPFMAAPRFSKLFANRHAFWHNFAIDRHTIIGKAPRRREIVEPLVAKGVGVAVTDAFNNNANEQFMRRRVAERARVFEKAMSFRAAISPRAAE
jgi:hypothetical protein